MAWPGTLPPLNETFGYGEQWPDAAIRTPTDSGAGKTRPKPDAPNQGFDIDQLLTTAQVATLETHYYTTLAKGSLTDTDTHPRTGASFTYRFVSGISLSYAGPGHYRAGFRLEVMP